MKQSIYAQSATPLYDVGYRIQVGLRVFHYCRAKTALSAKRGEGDGSTLLEMLIAFAVANAGDTTITLVTAAPAVHEFAGGWMACWDGLAVLPVVNLVRIKDNDAPVGPNTTFYLKDPLTRRVGILATDTNDVYRNIYNNVTGRAGGPVGASSQATVCVPLIDVTLGNYFWGQTWGPCLGIAHAGGGLGAVAGESGVWFSDDGSIATQAECASAALSQYAGFMLGDRRTPALALADSIFFMLQLAP